ncbi:MAG TPA: polymer-forming cytoskeletal protein [Candidatus Acidoferrales bacterium]|nr:polymer-forming cytoskeletal protein [Candidatus Acidoferrales bacterium]
MNHFDEMTALLYLDGQLDRGQAAETLAHTNICAECRALLESLKRETLFLEQSLQEKDPVPARFAAPARKSDLPWGWITVFGMAAAGIFTVWNGFVEPFEQQLNQAGFTGGNLMTMLFFSGAFWKGWSSVLSFLSFFAASVFAILALVMLRRFWGRSTAVGMVLGIFAAVLVFPLMLAAPVAQASEAVHGRHLSYTLASGQTVNTDLFVSAEFARIEGTVNGDLIVFSAEVEVDGHVTGDVISMARELRINGQVDGNIRGYAQTLNINGSVGKNVLAACQDFEMGTNAKIRGSLTLAGGNAMISGSVGRDITAAVGDTTLDGTIGQGIKIRGDNLRIGPDANIQGQAKYTGHYPAEVAPEAKLGSPVAFTPLKEGPDYSNWRFYWHRAEFWGAAFLFGLVLLLLLPGFFNEGLQASRRILPSLGLGVLFMFATPIIAGLVCFTVVGIGLAIPTIFIWLIALYAAQVFVATQAGNYILGAATGTGALVGRLAIGLVIIHALEMVPYHVGILAKLVVLWWGLGAIVLAIYRHLHRVMTAPAPIAA